MDCFALRLAMTADLSLGTDSNGAERRFAVIARFRKEPRQSMLRRGAHTEIPGAEVRDPYPARSMGTARACCYFISSPGLLYLHLPRRVPRAQNVRAGLRQRKDRGAVNAPRFKDGTAQHVGHADYRAACDAGDVHQVAVHGDSVDR